MRKIGLIWLGIFIVMFINLQTIQAMDFETNQSEPEVYVEGILEQFQELSLVEAQIYTNDSIPIARIIYNQAEQTVNASLITDETLQFRRYLYPNETEIRDEMNFIRVLKDTDRINLSNEAFDSIEASMGSRWVFNNRESAEEIIALYGDFITLKSFEVSGIYEEGGLYYGTIEWDNFGQAEEFNVMVPPMGVEGMTYSATFVIDPTIEVLITYITGKTEDVETEWVMVTREGTADTIPLNELEFIQREEFERLLLEADLGHVLEEVNSILVDY